VQETAAHGHAMRVSHSNHGITRHPGRISVVEHNPVFSGGKALAHKRHQVFKVATLLIAVQSDVSLLDILPDELRFACALDSHQQHDFRFIAGALTRRKLPKTGWHNRWR